jgi:hypothetical protein
MGPEIDARVNIPILKTMVVEAPIAAWRRSHGPSGPPGDGGLMDGLFISWNLVANK